MGKCSQLGIRPQQSAVCTAAADGLAPAFQVPSAFGLRVKRVTVVLRHALLGITQQSAHHRRFDQQRPKLAGLAGGLARVAQRDMTVVCPFEGLEDSLKWFAQITTANGSPP